MVKVKGRRGKSVSIEFLGIAEIVRSLTAKGKQIESKSDLEMARTANFVQDEVKESIVGNRAETKSVDTGKLGNAIDVKKKKINEYDVFVKKQRYKGTTITTDEVGKFLEFGTSKIAPRRHFRNTLIRNKDKLINMIANALRLR